MRFRAKHGRSEADAPFARMNRSGPEYSIDIFHFLLGFVF